MLIYLILLLVGVLMGYIAKHIYQKKHLQNKLNLITQFVDAWNQHDIDRVMSFMSNKATFYTSSGPHPYGHKYTGKEEIHRAFLSVLEKFPHGRWESKAPAFASGNNVTTPFIFTNPSSDGSDACIYGIDLWQFSGKKIILKDGYRKYPG